MDEDIWADPKMVNWLKHANDELRPMVLDSAVTMALLDGVQPDAKQAVELGFMILLDKPIIVAVVPGTPVPEHLARAADEIVEVDMNDPDTSARTVSAAIARLEIS